MKRVVLFGPPGVGKGTQGGRLAASLGVPAISTGDLFRAHVKNGTDLGKRLSTLIGSGDYVPDAITNSMLGGAARGAGRRGRVPARRLPADRRPGRGARPAARALAAHDARRRAAAGRIRRGPGGAAAPARRRSRAAPTTPPRSSGTDSGLYHAETEPLVALYDAADLVLRVDGVGTMDEVHERLLAAIGQREPSALS